MKASKFTDAQKASFAAGVDRTFSCASWSIYKSPSVQTRGSAWHFPTTQAAIVSLAMSPCRSATFLARCGDRCRAELQRRPNQVRRHCANDAERKNDLPAVMFCPGRPEAEWVQH
jgi:hypothetical protein